MKARYIIICLFIALLISLLSGHKTSDFNYYPSVMRVTEVTANEVTLQDCNGFLWSCGDPEDLEQGDLCGVLMNDNGTPETIFDDMIVSIRYCGR